MVLLHSITLFVPTDGEREIRSNHDATHAGVGLDNLYQFHRSYSVNNDEHAIEASNCCHWLASNLHQ